MSGIAVAAILNHGIASWLGGSVVNLVDPNILKWTIAILFFGFAIWTLNAGDESDETEQLFKHGAFLTTVIAFFIGEMGDKTQLAALALGAQFTNPFLVTTGTTLAMLAANGLPVFFGHKLVSKIPMIWIRRFASLLFFIFGLLILINHLH